MASKCLRNGGPMPHDSDPGTLNVLVCYPQPGGGWQREVRLPAGSTAADALRASGFAREFPDVDPWQAGVGVFGRSCAQETLLRDGDRVEIYRPLTFDPMESRRRRAEVRRQAKAGRPRR